MLARPLSCGNSGVYEPVGGERQGVVELLRRSAALREVRSAAPLSTQHPSASFSRAPIGTPGASFGRANTKYARPSSTAASSAVPPSWAIRCATARANAAPRPSFATTGDPCAFSRTASSWASSSSKASDALRRACASTATRAAACATSAGAAFNASTAPPSTSLASCSSRTTRAPHANSTRDFPSPHFCALSTAMHPTSPVRAGCVPPQGEASTPSTTTTRSPFTGSFRSGSLARSSPVKSRAITGRSRQTLSFASASARAASTFPKGASRSMVQVRSPRWKETVGAPSLSNAAESRCCPWCCCM